ncbi:MAG: chemotaxis protein CheW [Magnetospirillum sp. WYHS-4]
MSGNNFDWDTLKERLERSRQALAGSLAANPARNRATLRMRAEWLANRGRDRGAGARQMAMLSFRVRGETYAFELNDLVETASALRCTPIPGASPELVGVTNLRGEIRPVLDAATLLNAAGVAPPIEDDRAPDAAVVVFLRRQGAEVGLKVDALDRVRMVRADDLAAAASGAATASPFVKGVTREMLIVLDARAILALPIVGTGNRASGEETS